MIVVTAFATVKRLMQEIGSELTLSLTDAFFHLHFPPSPPYFYSLQSALLSAPALGHTHRMASTLVDLLSTPCPPPFIYVHHPHHASSSAIPRLPANCVVVRVDGIEHHSPRLLYSSAATSFARRLDHDAVTGEISTSDGFSRQLAQLWAAGRSQDKGKGKAKANGVNGHSGAEHVNGHDTAYDCLVLVITKAERLRHTFGHGWTMITRLAELVSASEALDDWELSEDWTALDCLARFSNAMGRAETATKRRSRASAHLPTCAYKRRSVVCPVPTSS